MHDSPEPPDRHPGTVLLADPDPRDREGHVGHLARVLCRVEEAGDGREALAKALTRPLAVAVLTASLPGISGLELCRLLRNDAATRDVPIVIVAANAAQTTAAQACGADAILTEPCRPEQLAGEVARLLRQSRDVRRRARQVGANARTVLADSHERLEAARATAERHRALSHQHQRRQTTEPPLPPPSLVCPRCDAQLRYDSSHVGGVSVRMQEQWDYFSCPTGCGHFQYRHRTRKLRQAG